MNDEDYIANSIPDKLYVNPYTHKGEHKGAYAQLIDESKETFIDEIEVTPRFRLALSMFYANDKQDFSTFKLTKLRYHKTRNWENDGEIQINGFQLDKLKQFMSIISSLNLSDAKKTRISLSNLDLDALSTVLGTDKGADFLKTIAQSPELTKDIFALAHKKAELEIFGKLLNDFENYKTEYISKHSLSNQGEEAIWQYFFEQNPWIFGHGLNYVFLGKDGNKLEQITTGATHNNSGKRIDALMQTKAKISQYVLIEIKKPSSGLLAKAEHRPGCWASSKELSEAVSQIQKTVFDFTKNNSVKVQVKDGDGRNTGDEIYKVHPKSYLVIGNLSQLQDHDDKFTCFELFRSSLNSPEILTYDELYERAKCIVDTLTNTKETA